MSSCCVAGCKYRYTPGSSIKLHRIPSGSRPFHANKRRLWLEALQQVNGNTKLNDSARVCSAHFISGEASMEYGTPDFVPSVFTCAEQSQTPKTKVKWVYGRRKRRRHRAKLGTEEKTTPPEADSPVDLQSSVSMETESELSVEMRALSTPSKEEEILTKEAESETKAVQSQTSSTDMTSPSFKVPAGIANLLLRSPIVLLKPIVSPAGDYQCEQCNLTFPSASQLVKHKQLHEEQKSLMCEVDEMCFTSQADLSEHDAVHKEEPSFPCNICDRSFLTSQNLKRHKLLHVKDGRKCLTCGVLFCRRHSRSSCQPKIKCMREPEEESSITEPQHVGSNLIPENCPPNEPEPEPSQTTEEPVPDKSSPVPDNSRSSETFTLLLTSSASTVAAAPPIPELLPKTCVVPTHLPAPHPRILPKIPTLVLVKSSCMPPPPTAIIKSKKQGTPFHHRSPVPDSPATFVQPQCPELPPSLRIFSPEYLTSALLEVKRNYEYIFSKRKDVKIRPLVKEELAETLIASKNAQTINPNKNERIAYDLEIIL